LALRRHGLFASGRAARTVHPSPLTLSMLNFPPKPSTRSRIPEIPTVNSGTDPTEGGFIPRP
jgi:hypothetical protein